MSKLYVEKSIPLQKFLGPLYGKMDGGKDIIYHKTVYDFVSLSEKLLQSGFSVVEKYDWKKTEHANSDDHSQCYIPHMQKDTGTLISLNLEAIK